MQAQIRKTSWGKNLLLGVGLLALLLLLAPAGAGAVDLVVDNGATKIVPPSIAYDNETIGDTGQGTLKQFSGSNTVNLQLTLGDQANGKGTYKLFSGTLSGGVGEIIGNDGTGSFKQFGGTNISLSLTLGQNNGSGTYQLTGGSLLVPFETIGNFGSGTFIQNGGSNTVLGDLTLAQFPGSSGTYRLNSGNLAVAGINEVIGIGGTGSFIQNGGEHTVADTLTLGLNPGGSGTYQLFSGNLSVNVEEIIGNSGIGSFTQYGGSHSVVGNLISGGALAIGAADNSSGSYQLYNGRLHVGVGYESIGVENGTGSFKQFGGTHAVDGTLNLGLLNGSGTYQLLGGSLSVFDENIGNAGTGVFKQLGGNHLVADALTLGTDAGSGTYDLNSGNLQAANEVVGFGGYGSFTQTSGNNIIASTLKLGELDTASGAYNLKSGSLSAAFEIIGDGGTGVVNQSGGNHSVANTLNVGLHGSGTYNLTGGVLSVAQEEVGAGAGGIGTFNQSGGKNTVAGFLVVSGLADQGSGTYNLTGGQLTAKNIVINGPFGPEGGNGHFDVMNTVTTVTGDVNNLGTVKTTNATVTWNGNFFNGGAYISDPSKQTFNKDLEVDRFGYIVGLTSQDLFIVKNDFLNHSVQDVNWNTAQAGLKFITGPDTSHTFAIAGDGTLSGHPFAWYSLNITGQTLRLQDGDSGANGAQWLQALIGAKFTGTTLTNIFNDDDSNVLNLYYDKNLAINAYLGGLDYTITGGAGGMLIAHTPLPPSALLLGSGLLGLGLLGYRRRRG
ncbi:MAG: hypothetical protein P8X65_05540 [Syntrophobacterales bacterium]|jgi:hypothetical protein